MSGNARARSGGYAKGMPPPRSLAPRILLPRPPPVEQVLVNVDSLEHQQPLSLVSTGGVLQLAPSVNKQILQTEDGLQIFEINMPTEQGITLLSEHGTESVTVLPTPSQNFYAETGRTIPVVPISPLKSTQTPSNTTRTPPGSSTRSPSLSPTMVPRRSDVMLTVAADSNTSDGLIASAAYNQDSYSNETNRSGSSGLTAFMQNEIVSPDRTKYLRSKEPLCCPFCPRVFHRNYPYTVHLRTHTKLRPYQCMICGRAFSQNSNVKRHIQTHKTFPNIAQLYDQTTSMLDKKGRSYTMWCCSFCPKMVHTQQKLLGHMNDSHSSLKRFICSFSGCDHLCDTATELITHQESHTRTLTYACPYCDQQFHSLPEVGEHQHAQHTFTMDEAKRGDPDKLRAKRGRVKSFICFDCCARFATLAALRQHQTRDRHKYSCDECPRVYTQQSQLRRHKHHKHSDKPQTHQCRWCQTSFGYRTTLRRHEQTVHADLYYDSLQQGQTDADGDQSASTNAVDAASEYLVTCEPTEGTNDRVADDTSTRKESQSAVRRTCATCSRRFSRMDALRRHILTVHVRTESYRCTFTSCQRQFTRLDQMKEHIQQVHVTNSGDGAFECDKCGNAYKRRLSLQVHQRTAHSTTPRQPVEFVCSVCKRTFARKSALIVHAKTHKSQK